MLWVAGTGLGDMGCCTSTDVQQASRERRGKLTVTDVKRRVDAHRKTWELDPTNEIKKAEYKAAKLAYQTAYLEAAAQKELLSEQSTTAPALQSVVTPSHFAAIVRLRNGTSPKPPPGRPQARLVSVTTVYNNGDEERVAVVPDIAASSSAAVALEVVHVVDSKIRGANEPDFETADANRIRDANETEVDTAGANDAEAAREAAEAKRKQKLLRRDKQENEAASKIQAIRRGQSARAQCAAEVHAVSKIQAIQCDKAARKKTHVARETPWAKLLQENPREIARRRAFLAAQSSGVHQAVLLSLNAELEH